MTIYTRTGDEGNTGRPGGQRVRKSDALVTAVGEVDELNSHVGLCLAAARPSAPAEVTAALAPVQSELLAVGALTAAQGQARGASLDDSAVARMERQIDAVWEKMELLTQFILPGGCELACRLHVARTVCRRAERAICAAADGGAPVPAIVLKYVNRLSDLLFAMARWANHVQGPGNSIWQGGGRE